MFFYNLTEQPALLPKDVMIDSGVSTHNILVIVLHYSTVATLLC